MCENGSFQTEYLVMRAKTLAGASGLRVPHSASDKQAPPGIKELNQIATSLSVHSSLCYRINSFNIYTLSASSMRSISLIPQLNCIWVVYAVQQPLAGVALYSSTLPFATPTNHHTRIAPNKKFI